MSKELKISGDDFFRAIREILAMEKPLPNSSPSWRDSSLINSLP